MANRTKAELVTELEAHGITDLDPTKATVAQLEEMLAFVADDDDDDEPELPTMTTEPDGDTDDELDVLLADTDDELDVDDLTNGMDASTADRIAELFGDAWEGDDDPEDLGEGDVPEPYVELIANYHVDTLRARDKETGEPIPLDKLLRGQFREVIEKARALGRKPSAFPVVAHNWPQSGSRRQIIVQVQVAPVRTSRGRRNRTTMRGDRL